MEMRFVNRTAGTLLSAQLHPTPITVLYHSVSQRPWQHFPLCRWRVCLDYGCLIGPRTPIVGSHVIGGCVKSIPSRCIYPHCKHCRDVSPSAGGSYFLISIVLKYQDLFIPSMDSGGQLETGACTRFLCDSRMRKLMSLSLNTALAYHSMTGHSFVILPACHVLH